MRNLKRALSLGLTAAMISGLMVMGSSAVSYPDSDQIQNQTAVEILGEIGVMVGDDNGNFNPTQDVTRAEMAVIITRILYGNDLNVDQFKGMNLFTDVPAWAEGFVNLCASLDIVAGVGDGKFAPNETVTAAQAALMLSRALGYFQNNAEFGNDWALAAIRRATSAGIIGDDMVLAANEGLSRDNVAQMTFNTLTKAVPVQYNELLNVYYNENQGITYALTFNYLQTLGYTNFDLVYDNGDTTIYGRPATTWGIGTYRTTTSDKDSGSRYDEALDANGGLISSNVQILSRDEIITVANEPTYTYTDGTAEEDIYDDLGAVICNDQRGQEDDEMYTWTVYVNGEEVFNGEENNTWNPWNRENSIPENNEGDNYQYTGDGAQTEIYVDDADQTVTVVEINYYLGQVSNVDEEDGTVSIREVSDLSDDNAELDDRDFATTAFEEDDYVVFTIDQNEDEDFYICEMVAPETVTGTVTRVNKNDTSDNAYLYLDRETKYNYSDKGHMVYDLNDANNERHPELEEDYTLYLDPNGYVLAYSGDTEVGFLYVQDSDEELSDWEARVVLADGTDDVVMVDSDLDHGNRAAINFGNEDVVEWATEEEDLNDFPNWVDSTELNSWNTIRGKITDIDYQIWEYETNADGDLYTLIGRQTKYMDQVQINNGESYVDSTSSTDDIVIDQNTIIVDVENNVAYTGYDEVPDISNAKIAYVTENDQDGRGHEVAEIIYVIKGDIYDADAMYFVITSHNRDTVKYDGDKYFEFDDMYVDGRHTSGLYVAYDALTDEGIATTDAGIDAGMVGKVFKVMKSIDDTYITDIELVDDWNYVDVATSSALNLYDGWTTAVNGEKYTTNSDTIYVMIEDIWDLDGDNWWEYEWTHTYNVDPAGYRDIIEDAQRDDDGYVTLAQVVKADGKTAELVYILYTRDRSEVSEPDHRTVTVNDGNFEVSGIPDADALNDKLEYVINQQFDVTLTPDDGYIITAVNVMAGDEKITAVEEDQDTGAWTVTIPAGTENVVINVTTVGQEYNLTFDDGTTAYWNLSVTDAEGNAVGENSKVTVGQTYTVTATANQNDDDHNGPREIRIDGVKASDAEFTVNGADPVKQTVTINNPTELRVYMEKMAANGLVYKQDGSVLTEDEAWTKVENCWYYTDMGTAATLTGTFTVDYNADGELVLSINAK